MDGLHPLSDDTTLPDVFLAGVPYQLTTALAFFRLRHVAAWERLQAGRVPTIELHAWDDWDKLGDRLGARLGQHIWHPAHFDHYYATMADLPVATPGAVPLTMKQVRERRLAATPQLALLEEET